jgi:hypothetical protein
MAVAQQQMADDLKHRMADLNVRGTTIGPNILYPNGFQVFSVLDFIQHARTDVLDRDDAVSLFHYLENRHKEDFRGHVLMISTPRDNTSTYHSPTMGIRSLLRLLSLLGDKVEPDFRRDFEQIYSSLYPQYRRIFEEMRHSEEIRRSEELLDIK